MLRSYRYRSLDSPSLGGRYQGRVLPAEFTSKTLHSTDHKGDGTIAGSGTIVRDHAGRESAQKKIATRHSFPYVQTKDDFHA